MGISAAVLIAGGDRIEKLLETQIRVETRRGARPGFGAHSTYYSLGLHESHSSSPVRDT